MKTKAAIVLCGLAALLVWLVLATRPVAAATPFIALSRVAVPEMPAQAADLVQAADPLEREATAAAVLRAVATMTRPGVMPYVVSAICRRQPEVTGVVVATAIQLQPAEELAFCRAAVCAAPDQVASVVASACQAAPDSYASVALVAFRRLPDAGPLILYGLTNAVPGLIPAVDQAVQQVGATNFPALISQIEDLAAASARAESKK